MLAKVEELLRDLEQTPRVSVTTDDLIDLTNEMINLAQAQRTCAHFTVPAMLLATTAAAATCGIELALLQKGLQLAYAISNKNRELVTYSDHEKLIETFLEEGHGKQR